MVGAGFVSTLSPHLLDGVPEPISFSYCLKSPVQRVDVRSAHQVTDPQQCQLLWLFLLLLPPLLQNAGPELVLLGELLAISL